MERVSAAKHIPVKQGNSNIKIKSNIKLEKDRI
jgi:hypothetical protein